MNASVVSFVAAGHWPGSARRASAPSPRPQQPGRRRNFASPRRLSGQRLAAGCWPRTMPERRAVGVQPLAWDPNLRWPPSAYARQLAVERCISALRPLARRGVGENLWMGTRGAFQPERMIGNWASEKRWFQAGMFPDVSRTGPLVTRLRTTRRTCGGGRPASAAGLRAPAAATCSSAAMHRQGTSTAGRYTSRPVDFALDRRACPRGACRDGA